MLNDIKIKCSNEKDTVKLIDEEQDIVMTFKYNNNELIEVIDKDGYNLNIKRCDNKIFFSDSNGYVAIYDKNNNGNIVKMNDSHNYSASYQYNDNHDFIQFKDSLHHNIKVGEESKIFDNHFKEYIKYVDTGKIIVQKNDNSFKIAKYNKNDRLVYYKNSLGVEKWYNDNGVLMRSKYKHVERWYYDTGRLKVVRKSDGSVVKYSTTGQVIFSK